MRPILRRGAVRGGVGGGLHFGLGSTLAFPRAAAEAIGGLETLVDYLADDHDWGG